jgi:hypothetical protein
MRLAWGRIRAAGRGSKGEKWRTQEAKQQDKFFHGIQFVVQCAETKSTKTTSARQSLGLIFVSTTGP